MELNILLFGITKDIVGSDSMTVEVEGETVGELKVFLEKEYPEFKKLKSLMIAVNNEYATNEALQINSKDEIALIPPVSGG